MPLLWDFKTEGICRRSDVNRITISQVNDQLYWELALVRSVRSAAYPETITDQPCSNSSTSLAKRPVKIYKPDGKSGLKRCGISDVDSEQIGKQVSASTISKPQVIQPNNHPSQRVR